VLLVFQSSPNIDISWESLFARLQRYQDRAAFEGRVNDSEGRAGGKEVRPMEPDKEQSWLRLLITTAVDWRLVIAVLLLLLALLKK